MNLRRAAGLSWTAVKERLQYKLSFYMTLFATLTFSILYYMVWTAIYKNSENLTMPWQQLITYIMIGQVVSFTRFSPAERGPIFGMAERIYTGNISLDLIRPIGFQRQRFYEAVGAFIVEFVWVIIPAFLFCVFIFKISLPPNIFSTIGFFISIIIAFIVSFSLNSILMMLNFWTVNAQGLHKAKKAIIEILAGSIIPFEFFPVWLKEIALHLPFQSIAYIPISIYTGKIQGIEIIHSLGEQIIWAIVMLVASRLLWIVASRRITIFGG